MATSNRDRIGRMFEVLSEALDAFITRDASSRDRREGLDFLVAAVDSDKGIAGKEYSRDDPQVQIRLLTENVTARYRAELAALPWSVHPRRRGLRHPSERRAERLGAHEVIRRRHCLAGARSGPQLLTAIGQGYAADKIDAIRLDLRRIATGKQDQKSLKSSTVTPNASGLAPWRQVLKPRDEVATGSFQSSEFAADLYKVARRPGGTSWRVFRSR